MNSESDESDFELGLSDRQLTEDELDRLSDALGDAFSDITAVSLNETAPDVDEPFWKVGGSMPRHIERVLEERTHLARVQGWSDERILELWRNFLENDPNASVPPWTGTNPFRFDPEEIWDVIKPSCDKSLGDQAASLRENGGNRNYTDMIPLAKPFSRVWFELWILADISAYRQKSNAFLFGDGNKNRTVRQISYLSARIGRAIEHYRWRFVFGAHALRGKRVIKGASEGGQASAVTAQPKTKKALAEMQRLISRGHTISSAAAIAASNGFGKSKDANRKLWNRHKRK